MTNTDKNELLFISEDHPPDSEKASQHNCESDAIDRLVCHPVLGYVIFILVMFCAFQITFSLADGLHWVPIYTHHGDSAWHWEMSTPVNLVRTLFDVWLSSLLEPRLPWGENSPAHSLIFDGIITGVGSVVMFVPVIFFMFLVLSFLEQSGYIARVAMIMDRLMHLFGLQGQSVMPMILAGGICGGCAVPAIMATQCMKHQRERILTILILPMMNCGAKMPVYLLLVGTFFSAWKPLIMTSLVFISWGIALVCAKFLSRTIFCGRCSRVPMELSAWQWPRFSKITQTAALQSWSFMQKAGTVILVINMLLWCLMYYPRPSVSAGKPDNSERLAGSYAGRIGRTLEPVSCLAGFDWRDNVALIGGFVAKEVIVSSLGTLHRVEPVAESKTSNADTPQVLNPKEIKSRMIGAKLISDPDWNGIKAFAMILFVMIYAPCVATCVVIYRETRQLRWVTIAIVFNTSVAFLLAAIVYQIGGFFF